MQLFDAIHSRYSYRGAFLPDVPTQEHIDAILDAAIAAPAGVNIRTTSYVVVTDAALLQEIYKVTKLPPAPVAIMALNEDIPNKLRRNFQDENFAVAAQNILLAVTALGYATCLNDILFTYGEFSKPVTKLLNLPRGKKLKAIFSIGKPDTPGTALAKPARESLVQYNAFA